MNDHPRSKLSYPLEWIESLDSLNEMELYSIDSKQNIEKITSEGLQQFINEALKLSKLPAIPEVEEIPLEDWAFNGVKNKKRHEIQKIIPILKSIKERTNFEYIIDIGGGVGHLSRILAHYHGIPSVSVDKDSEFQKIGVGRLSKYRKLEGHRNVNFVNLSFGENNSEELLKTIFKSTAMTLGLHTCGPLANIVIQKSIEYKTTGLLSFGCCYHGLNPNKDFPLSNFYKENSFLKLNLFALTLATRAHSAMSFSDYQTKERVKYYRYALHLFLVKFFDNKNFIEVGECHIRTYWGPFSVYIRQKLLHLKLVHNFSDQDFDHFYNDPINQKELRIMFLCNIVRWQIGRVLEIYLLLDRCIYLEEQGFEVKIEEYFKEALSPRNIGILALLKK